ncbi:hypothetical protein B0H15DRAFT_869144, partial [Mycena belliarum]
MVTPPKTRFLELTRPSARALHAYGSILPDSLKPIDVEVAKLCQHKEIYTFSLNLGDRSPAKAAQVMAHTRCQECTRKYISLNNPTPQEQADFVEALADNNEETTPTRKARPPKNKKATEPAAKKVPAKSQQTKGSKESATTATATKVSSATLKTKSKGKPDDILPLKEMSTAAPQTKPKAKDGDTPPRKKVKTGSATVSPAVPSAGELSAAVPRNIKVYLYIQANTPAISSHVAVKDCRRFRFSATHLFQLSNAGGNPSTLYERYSPFRERFTSAEESGVLGVINLERSGSTLIYRQQGIQNSECPGLFALLMELHSLSDCIGGGSFPSFPEVREGEAGPGPSTMKRRLAEVAADSDYEDEPASDS